MKAHNHSIVGAGLVPALAPPISYAKVPASRLLNFELAKWRPKAKTSLVLLYPQVLPLSFTRLTIPHLYPLLP